MNRICAFSAVVIMTGVFLESGAQELDTSWQEQPDFSGTWSVAESAINQGQQLIIEQNDSSLLVISRQGSLEERFRYNLDGSESRSTIRQETHVSRAEWVGSALVIRKVIAVGTEAREALQVFALQSDNTLAIMNVDANLYSHYTMLAGTAVFDRER
jgi:hypothetical protein